MAILKLTDICKDYMQGKEPVRVLKNINLTVEKGEYVSYVAGGGYVTGSGVNGENGGVIKNSGTLKIYGGKYVYAKKKSGISDSQYHR